MSNDDRLTRRDSPTPVSVRRPPPTLGDPTLLPPGAAPPAPVNPHVIYINNNIAVPAPAIQAAAPPPPPVAPPPAVQHHHYNTQNTTHRIVYRIPSPPAHSALGTASMALGILACLICWVPWLGLVAVPVGAIGAVIGVVGVLISLLFRKSSASLPVAGIFVCSLAAGISIASTRSLPYWRRQLDQAIVAVLPPAALPSHLLAPAPLPPPSVLMSPPDFGSIPSVPPATAIPLKPPPGAVPAHPAIVSHLDPSIAAARDQLAAAEQACDQRTKQTPQYQTVVQAAADARAHETALRDNFPGSPELVQASLDMIKADNAVSDLLTHAQAVDSQVMAARDALVAAHAALNH